MWTPRFRLIILMIGIALLTLVVAISAFLITVNRALYDFYGPGGELERRQKSGVESQGVKAGTRPIGPSGDTGKKAVD